MYVSFSNFLRQPLQPHQPPNGPVFLVVVRAPVVDELLVISCLIRVPIKAPYLESFFVKYKKSIASHRTFVCLHLLFACLHSYLTVVRIDRDTLKRVQGRVVHA